MSKIYALYKGDDFVLLGTIQEISQKLKISIGNLYKIKNRTKQGVVKDKGMALIEVEDEEGEPNE